MTGKFLFTITDVARFLGKSPVTLRGWERKGLISFPRDSGGDRKFTLAEVRNVATSAKEMKRISKDRLKLVEASVTMLELIEKENN
jgi:predicted site-specific integrase-resolvase